MKTKLSTLFLFLTSFLFAQQNLVPNPSFEEFDTCPNSLSQINYATSWRPFTQSTDYYNVCSTTIATVPSNSTGYQNAYDGNAYAGLIVHLNTQNYREYIGCTLLDSLVVGQKYYLSFKTNAANVNLAYSNNIGMLFSNKSYLNISPHWPDDSVLIKNYSHLHSSNIISDTLNWTTIKGVFIADSSYKYLIIGNFYDDIYTDTIMISTGYSMEYYYIDDICVSTDSLTCNNSQIILENNSSLNFVNIFPIPTTKYLTINYIIHKNSNFELYDLLGAKRMVAFLDNNLNTTTIDLAELNNGIYYYAVIDKLGFKIKTGKLIIQK